MGPIKSYWASNSVTDREFVRANVLSLEAVKWQYETGSQVPIAPEAAYLDWALMQRPGNEDVQLDLFYDYQENIKTYPRFHEYLRESKVPVLVAWGKHDPFLISPGAVKGCEVHLLDAGHFVLESNVVDIAGLVLKFLERKGI